MQSVYDADIDEIDKYTPVSSNPKLMEEVQKMLGMSEVIYNRGVAQGIEQGISLGISQGISQGEERKLTDNIRQLKEYFKKEHPDWTDEQAEEMAKGILK